jgi:protein gp37
MGERTAIGWTDHTFNPWWGCTKISPGCTNCYAEALAKRVGRVSALESRQGFAASVAESAIASRHMNLVLLDVL